MTQNTHKLGLIAIAIGGIALLLALLHFWAGPFSPQPTLETVVADQAVSIRDATIKALKGEEYRELRETHWDTDKIVDVLTVALAGLALILSMLSFARREPFYVAAGGVVLGISAIAFQFLAMYAMLLLVVLLVVVVLAHLGF